MFKPGSFIAAMLFIAGCGFQPLHRQQPLGDNGSAALWQIAVAPIPERLGQILRIELTNRLTPDGTPRTPVYVLDVSVKESKQELGVRKDATATRANLVITANFVLSDKRTGENLLRGSVRSINSYNILDADFATLSAEADAQRRAARDLATEINSRLGIFLSHQS